MTWKWLVGTLIGVGMIVAGGVVTIKSDIAAMKVSIESIEKQMVLERGLANRLDAEIRNCKERIIWLEAQHRGD